ncbi:hypothetical protein [Sphingobacterium suaedae]|uniref:UTRA domain-containing protein n=1 Tax=Sphingobacterium suaedae TaxID=1686402 RepID=A0ABW5KJB4_9SPHI
MDYADREITEMAFGIYRESMFLRVDLGYVIDITKVTGAGCVLSDVSHLRRPKMVQPGERTQQHIRDKRAYFVESYYLETSTPICGFVKHEISSSLNTAEG